MDDMKYQALSKDEIDAMTHEQISMRLNVLMLLMVRQEIEARAIKVESDIADEALQTTTEDLINAVTNAREFGVNDPALDSIGTNSKEAAADWKSTHQRSKDLDDEIAAVHNEIDIIQAAVDRIKAEQDAELELASSDSSSIIHKRFNQFH